MPRRNITKAVFPPIATGTFIALCLPIPIAIHVAIHLCKAFAHPRLRTSLAVDIHSSWKSIAAAEPLPFDLSKLHGVAGTANNQKWPKQYPII
jgi:hypothetical protein